MYKTQVLILIMWFGKLLSIMLSMRQNIMLILDYESFFKYFDEYEEGERGRLNAFTYYNVYWDISWRLSQTVVKYK